MDVGVFLGTQHLPDANIRQEFENHLVQTRAIRDAGFDALWLAQHYLTYPDQFLQTTPMMARLAAETGDMTLGTNIFVLPLHNIIDVAEQYATLDIITGGKLIFGAALGYRDIEYNNFGVDRKRRAKLFDEQIDALKLLWEEDNATFEGEFVKFENISIRPRPLQRPRPPIWLGAAADPAIKRAAIKGDAWIATSVTQYDAVKEQVGLYHQVRKDAGLPRHPEGITKCVELYCAPTKAEAMEMGAPFMANKYKAYYSWGMGKNVPGVSGEDLPLEELIKGRFVVGDPEECIAECQRHRDELECSHLLVRMNFPGMPLENVLKGIKLFGEEVLPHIR
ncbi:MULTISPECIES: LLM class flavin-dependent oxidoreductase [Limibacillus]|jgi:alkanesulfonate monooxygenase SsuD/methylene tetrahydromethanopterin reductase-like flavin-dependent oxidoreductase (luciferase family)|uniref:Alkanesulfonate monooxygenase SsuD/methylene tetrahydromethanopterin reductase-like flavin-dependent oxidoreductase (Luciferase family) n=1 Tax=Limibacillus halophilus TaxID=1579333 RepID=A0A839SP73_9PROT|nr:LLM class flavin-dependent oxidoreductase [Limibacillus halophilus]MBB3064252.1 alkanesulfonate monooxygenase SsuD/methylene tetrahydromethanopterin reductase-like flavin-dependent oxidoreductase (luciferase family) [Limibacillus halophilus]